MNMPFQTFDEQGDASNCAPRLAALRAELANRGVHGFLDPARGRASGRVCAQARRAPLLADRVHRLGGPRHRADGEGRGLRRRPLHAAGQEPDRHDAVRDPRSDERRTGELDRGEPAEGRAARLRSLAAHARRHRAHEDFGGARGRHAGAARAQSAGSGLAGSARAAARARGPSPAGACRRDVGVQARPPGGGAEEARRRCRRADAAGFHLLAAQHPRRGCARTRRSCCRSRC